MLLNGTALRLPRQALRVFLKLVFAVAFRAPEVAARPAVLACVSPEFERETNRYLHMFNPKRMDEKCYDAAASDRLWERSVELLRGVDAWPYTSDSR